MISQTEDGTDLVWWVQLSDKGDSQLKNILVRSQTPSVSIGTFQKQVLIISKIFNLEWLWLFT